MTHKSDSNRRHGITKPYKGRFSFVIYKLNTTIKTVCLAERLTCITGQPRGTMKVKNGGATIYFKQGLRMHGTFNAGLLKSEKIYDTHT